MAIEISTTEPPEDITPEECDSLRAALIANVEEGMIDPLMSLTDEQELLLIRLAYNDPFNLDKVRRAVQDAIRRRRDGEVAARRFTLKPYLQKAKQIKTDLAEATALRARMAARNLKVIEGGKSDTEATDIEREAGGDTKLAAKLFSDSAFLKSLGILESKYKGRVWYDDFYNQPFTDWNGGDDDKVITQRPVDEFFMLNLMATLMLSDTRLARGLSLSMTEQACHYFAETDRRHEPRDWLKKLEWDGTARLSDWLGKVYGVDDAQYHKDVGRCWLVSMVARMMDPGCKVDTMPVLIGPQGNNKSTSLGILGGKWYSTLNISIDKQQDFLMSLNGRLLGEVAELDAISRAADSRVKTMLSTATDNFRPPYGRVVKEFKRTCVLVGSTNDMTWHKDDTGGRRYWPIECRGVIDVRWLKENRDQLFAEAKVLYDGGASWWDVDRVEQERRVAQHHTDDPWQERIESWIKGKIAELWTGPDSDADKIEGDPTANEEGAHWGTLLTTSRITAQCLMIPTERQGRVTSLKVAGAMRQLGFELTATRIPGGGVVKAWLVTRQQREAQSDDGQKLLPYQGDES